MYQRALLDFLSPFQKKDYAERGDEKNERQWGDSEDGLLEEKSKVEPPAAMSRIGPEGVVDLCARSDV